MYFDKKTMAREYLFITNKAEIRDKLAEHGMDNCILLDHDIPDDKDVQIIKSKEKKGHFFLMYFRNMDQHLTVRKIKVDKQIRRATLMSNMFQLPFTEIEEYKDTEGVWDDEYPSPNITLSRFLEIIDQIADRLDDIAEYRGWILHSDHKNRCGNCHTMLEDGVKYCTICGTMRGEGLFQPYNNATKILYGSPSIIKWRCPKCNAVWVDWSFSKTRYCKECGEQGEYIKSDSPDMQECLEMTAEEARARMKRLLDE